MNKIHVFGQTQPNGQFSLSAVTTSNGTSSENTLNTVYQVLRASVSAAAILIWDEGRWDEKQWA